jgi:hypothetical protein
LLNVNFSGFDPERNLPPPLIVRGVAIKPNESGVERLAAFEWR